MKRLSLLLLLGFALSTAFSGCFIAGPGVDPPENNDEGQMDASGPTESRDSIPPGTGGSGAASQNDPGAPITVTGGTTGATAGAGGTVVGPPTMDAGAADGGTSIDGGIGEAGVARDAGVDDDAGSEQ